MLFATPDEVVQPTYSPAAFDSKTSSFATLSAMPMRSPSS